jgi:hypothetical protein
MLDIALTSTSVKTDRLDSPAYPDEAVIRAGQEAWCRLRSNATWDDWKQVGKAHVIGRHKAMIEAGANAPIGRRYNEAFSAWQREFGFDLDSGDRTRLFEVMSRLAEIEKWLATLTTCQRLHLNHPTSILRKWKASTAIPTSNAPTKPKPSSLLAQQEAANVELQEEVHQLKKKLSAGSIFSRYDSTKHIITAITGTFDGMPNKTAKVEEIMRGLNKWVKEQKMMA